MSTNTRFIAYVITNSVNEKRYIGVTTMTLKRRWGCHKAEAFGTRASQRMLCKALRKYGLTSFSIEHIASAYTREALGELEILLINQCGTRAPHGYNMTDGGHGTQGRQHSDDAKRRIGLAGEGRIMPLKTRLRISLAHCGKTLTAEHRANLSAAKLGRKRPLRSDIHKQRISEGLRKAHARRKALVS